MHDSGRTDTAASWVDTLSLRAVCINDDSVSGFFKNGHGRTVASGASSSFFAICAYYTSRRNAIRRVFNSINHSSTIRNRNVTAQ